MAIVPLKFILKVRQLWFWKTVLLSSWYTCRWTSWDFDLNSLHLIKSSNLFPFIVNSVFRYFPLSATRAMSYPIMEKTDLISAISEKWYDFRQLDWSLLPLRAPFPSFPSFSTVIFWFSVNFHFHSTFNYCLSILYIVRFRNF